MTREEEKIADGEELTRCPDCGSALNSDGLHGVNGIRTATIRCSSENCNFTGREEHVIDKTFRRKN